MNMSYYNLFLSFFNEDGVGRFQGLFSIHHLIFTVLGLLVTILLLYLSRSFTSEKIEKLVRILFIVLVVLEILKIIWNLLVRTDKSMNNWVPLYFCSLFIYALAMVGFGKKKIKNIGIILIIYGQVIGALAFILYPSSSIGIHPLIHLLTIHSFIYHVLALYTGLLLVISGYYKENDTGIKRSLKSDFLWYFVTTMAIEAVVYIFNLIFKTNLMFLNEAGVVPVLEIAQKIFGVLYPLVIAVTQAVGTFFLGYLLVKVVELAKNKCKEKNHEEA